MFETLASIFRNKNHPDDSFENSQEGRTISQLTDLLARPLSCGKCNSRDANLKHMIEDNDLRIWIECANCGTKGSHASSSREAIKKWNT